jgi:hypothetical protein
MKTGQFLGLIALAAATLHGQTQPPTTGAQYWSSSVPFCNGPLVDAGGNTVSFVRLSGPINIMDSSGAVIGSSCRVSGTFAWLAAGGTWSTAIRVAGPASGAIGVDYTFYDTSGNRLSLDSTSPNGAASSNDVSFALNVNQPSEVRLLGAPSEAPQYTNTQTGSVYAQFYCPDPLTCELVLPQLLYSFLPIKPWSLSVPIAWDGFFSSLQPSGIANQWSAVGVNDATHFMSLVILSQSQSSVASIFTVSVYDNSGQLVGQGTTPPIAGANAVTGEGGTQGVLLSSLITTPLPSGVLKVSVNGGSNFSSVSILQFNGDSATSLQVSFDSGPSPGLF